MLISSNGVGPTIAKKEIGILSWNSHPKLFYKRSLRVELGGLPLSTTELGNESSTRATTGYLLLEKNTSNCLLVSCKYTFFSKNRRLASKVSVGSP